VVVLGIIGPCQLIRSQKLGGLNQRLQNSSRIVLGLIKELAEHPHKAAGHRVI
jgi:hypothetical protein